MAQTERQLLAKIRMQLRRCAGWDADEIASDREDALDYYFQRPRGDEVTGRSKVVDGTLSSMVEANLATMMKAVKGKQLAEFESFGEADAIQAQLESATVTQFLMQRNNGYVLLASAIKDALLLRNGFAQIEIDEQTRVTHRTYRNVTREAIPDLLGETGTLTSFKDGVARVRHEIRSRKFLADATPPENFLYLKNWHKLDLQEIPFCAKRCVWPRSDMILKWPESRRKIQQLKKYHQETKPDGLARNRGKQASENIESIDKSQDLIEFYICWILMDDGTGVSERRRIVIAGENQNSIIHDEPVALVPNVTGTAILIPHRMQGMSLYDKLRQEQDMRTGLKRAGMDNFNANNKNRTAYLDGLVNQDDMDDGRINGSVRVAAEAQDVRRAVFPMSVNDMSGGIRAWLDASKPDRAEMGGAALDLQTAGMQMNDRLGSEGLDRAYSVMEQLAALFMDLIANSLLRNMYLLAHETLRMFWDEPVNVKIGGKWIEQTPTQWPERTGVSINLGMSAGERARIAGVLERSLDKQIQLFQAGGADVIVDWPGFYANVQEWLRVNEVPNAERLYVDPESDRSVAAQQSLAETAAQDKQARRALLQQAVALEQLRTGEQKYEHDTELQYKYWSDVLKSQIEEAKIAGSATTELIKAKEVPNGRANGAANGRAGAADSDS